MVSHTGRPWRLWWFIATEVLCLAGFALLLHQGKANMAMAMLLVVPQLFVIGLLIGSDFLLLAAFSVLLPLAGLELLPDLYREFVLYGTLLLLAGFSVTRYVTREREVAGGLGKIGAVALTVGVIAIAFSTASAFVAGRGSFWMVRYAIGTVFVLLAVAVFASVPQNLTQVRRLLVLIASVHLATCLAVPLFAGPALGVGASKAITTPFGSVTTNLFGFFIGPVTALLAGVATDARRRSRMLALLGVLILLATLVYTRSRGAWLGFGIAFLYILFRVRSWKLLVLAAAAVVAILSLDVFRVLVQSRAEQTAAQDPAITGRFLLWLAALRAFAGHWLFGIGPEAFTLQKYAYGFPALLDPFDRFNTHNFYLEIAVGLGLAGGLAFFGTQAVAMFRLVRLGQRPRSVPGAQGLVIGLLAALLAYSVHGLVESPAWHIPTLTFWAVLVGLALATHRILKSGNVPGPTPNKVVGQ